MKQLPGCQDINPSQNRLKIHLESCKWAKMAKTGDQCRDPMPRPVCTEKLCLFSFDRSRGSKTYDAALVAEQLENSGFKPSFCPISTQFFHHLLNQNITCFEQNFSQLKTIKTIHKTIPKFSYQMINTNHQEFSSKFIYSNPFERLTPNYDHNQLNQIIKSNNTFLNHLNIT